MSRKLDDLSDDFRPLAFELLARFTEAGIAVVIVDTLRSLTEHQHNLAAGTSWTALSKHLDGYQRGSIQPGSDAIDVCPFEHYALHGPDKLAWSAADPTWARMGQIGEAVISPRGFRLRWGGRFRPPAKPDYGHFELVRT